MPTETPDQSIPSTPNTLDAPTAPSSVVPIDSAPQVSQQPTPTPQEPQQATTTPQTPPTQQPTSAPQEPQQPAPTNPPLNDTPAPMTSTIMQAPLYKPKNKFIPLSIVLGILALGGIVASALTISKSSRQETEIITLKNELARYESILGTNNSDSETANSPEGATNNPEGATSYLEPAGWDVKFAYPAGVTAVVADVQDVNFDGALYVTSITKDGKTYDINLCGGTSAYQQYPFFLGTVIRWDSAAAHESWQTRPSTTDNTLLLTQNSVSYYTSNHGGNGCDTGDNADYTEAVNLTSQLLRNITAK